MLTPEDLVWRRQGIGSSDAKIIANGTAEDWRDLRNEKLTGDRPPVSKQTQLFFDLGHAIENVCVSYYNAHVSPVKFTSLKAVSAHDDYFRCTLDAMLETGNVLEAKSHFMDRSIDELIEKYWPQLQHQMFVTNTGEAHLAVIFGHYAKFEERTVERDQAFLDIYRIKAYQFKHYVDTGVLPVGMEIVIPTNIVRGRDHIWLTGDNQVKPLAENWLANKAIAEGVTKAEKDLKALVPDDCRSASWFDDEGVGITIKVDKAGKKSLRLALDKKQAAA